MNLDLEKCSISTKVEIKDLSLAFKDQSIELNGFMSNIKVGKRFSFIVLRDGTKTVQLFVKTDTKIKELCNESYVKVKGIVSEVKDKIKSCTVSHLEIKVEHITVLGVADSVLPFLYKDVSYTLEEMKKYDFNAVSHNLCLDNRSLYLRSPQGQAFTVCIDAFMFAFRDYLRKHKFVEVKTPKLICGTSEGGSNCFSVDFYKKKACLAQSPQLYKQMCIVGGLKRVYEIGHVYRAEESNVNRYLCEFVGLDLEMECDNDYNKLISVIYGVITYIFQFVKKECAEELDTIKKYFPFEEIVYPNEPVIVTHKMCIDFLKEENIKIDYNDDFNSESEKILGRIIKEKYNTDIFVCKDYPVSCRPFYTYVDPETNLTRSYDFILRGEEILSGAQRISDYKFLIESINRCEINSETLQGYLNAFKCGVPPHGGAGIGLERLMKAYFSMKDIRYFSMFPRDPNRLYP